MPKRVAERDVIAGNNKNGVLIGLNPSVTVLGNYILARRERCDINVANDAAGGLSPVTFSDAPVFREVVNDDADVLATVFADGTMRSARTIPFGDYRFTDVAIGETHTLSVSGKRACLQSFDTTSDCF